MDFQTLNHLLKCGSEFGHSRIRECGISETECMLCSYICAHPQCAQEAAVSALRLDKTTAAKALQSLEVKGFIRCGTDEADRRRKRLIITEAGRLRMSEVLDLHDRWLDRVLSALTEAEQAQFEQICAKLLTAAESLLATTENGSGETFHAARKQTEQ